MAKFVSETISNSNTKQHFALATLCDLTKNRKDPICVAPPKVAKASSLLSLLRVAIAGIIMHTLPMEIMLKGAFILANFACDFALSLHVLLNKNYLFSLLNVQASAKSRTKSRQCKHTLKGPFPLWRKLHKLRVF